MLQFIKEKQPVKLGELLKELAAHNPASIRKDLQYLVRELEIEKHGNNRGTVYTIRKDK